MAQPTLTPRFQPLKPWRSSLVLGLLMTAAVVALRWMGGFQFLEWKLLDTMLRLRPAEATDQRITLVTIDDVDIQAIGTYPIPDGRLADLLQTIHRYEPRGIGLDIFRDFPVEPGHQKFLETLRSIPQIVAVERQFVGSPIPAPQGLPSEQIGFVDVPLDSDGFLRRELLSAFDSQARHRLSLTIQLTNLYLEPEGIELENGLRDPIAMRYGSVEFARFHPNSGGYVRANADGNQIFVNPRSGTQPFQVLSLQEVEAGDFPEEWLRDRIVLIGITALSIKDYINSDAIQGINPGLVSGIEFRAHALSQILSAVLDRRPLLRAWNDLLEYGWILLWGLAGLGLRYWTRSPQQQLLSVFGGCMGLGVAAYGLLLTGLWLTVVPAMFAFLLNGIVLYSFHLYDQGLRDRIRERQQVIEQTFTAIHNGPLQSLAALIRHTQGENPAPISQVHQDLKHLNHSLRLVYENIRQESLDQGTRFHLSHDRVMESLTPLHEILYEIYQSTLERPTNEFPHFQTLKFKVITFEPMAEENLSFSMKQDITRCFEEMLCNCGKHAVGATRLTVICCHQDKVNRIQVIDNGSATFSAEQASRGRGSQQAQQLAQQLGGSFERCSIKPKGVSCTLLWSEKKSMRQRFLALFQRTGDSSSSNL